MNGRDREREKGGLRRVKIILENCIVSRETQLLKILQGCKKGGGSNRGLHIFTIKTKINTELRAGQTKQVLKTLTIHVDANVTKKESERRGEESKMVGNRT